MGSYQDHIKKYDPGYLKNNEEMDYDNFKYFKFELYEKFNLNKEVDNDL